MRTLTRKALRDLLELGWRTPGIAVILALGVWIYTGGFMARDTIFNTRDHYYDQLRLADLDVYFDGATASEMPEIKVPGVRHEKRFYYQTSLDMAGREPAAIIVIHQHRANHPEVNDLLFVEGKPLEKADREGILLERSFAEAHGFKVGDTIGLRSLGFPIQVKVKGIVVSPEYLIPMGSPYELLPVKGSLGIAFANMDQIVGIFGYPMYNDICFLYEPGSDPKEKKGQILKALSGLELVRITERDEQFSYKFLQEDLKGFGIFVPAVVSLVGIVVCVVMIVVFNRLVQSQRREIGVLMALGYAPRSIFLSFLLIGLTIGVLGGALGTAASPLMCRLISDGYAGFLGMPAVKYLYPAGYVIEGLLISLSLSLLSCTPPLLAIFRISPQDAIRHTDAGRGLLRLLDLTRIIRFRSLVLKFSLRNLLRRPGLSFATIALIALAIAICTAFYASSESWEHYAHKALTQEKWDLIATFRVALSREEAEKAWNRKQLTNIRPIRGGAGEVIVGDYSRDLVLNAVSELSDVTELSLTEGRDFSSDDAFEVLFSSIDDLPVKVGDRITIRSGSSDHSFTVVGFLERMTIGMAYIPMGTARKIIGEKYHGFYANTRLSPEEIKKIVYTDENVAWVQPKGDIKKAVFEYLAQARVITQIALWVSIFLAVLFLLTGVTINIREREGEYATFASLGYSNAFLSRVILSETVLLGLFGLLLSIPLSYLFSVYLNHEMAEAWIELDLYLDARDVVEVMICAFLFLPFAALPGLRTILTMDIPQAVRRRSFG